MHRIPDSLRRNYILFFAMGLTARGVREQNGRMGDAKVLMIAACLGFVA
jgi:hypothetical protein